MKNTILLVGMLTLSMSAIFATHHVDAVTNAINAEVNAGAQAAQAGLQQFNAGMQTADKRVREIAAKTQGTAEQVQRGVSDSITAARQTAAVLQKTANDLRPTATAIVGQVREADQELRAHGVTGRDYAYGAAAASPVALLLWYQYQQAQKARNVDATQRWRQAMVNYRNAMMGRRGLGQAAMHWAPVAIAAGGAGHHLYANRAS